jgi:predicted Zn-dependent protease
MTSGDYDRAALEYARQLQKNPSDSRTGVLYGYSLYKGGHYEQAWPALEPLFTGRHSSYAPFWAALAAIQAGDAEKLNNAWNLWRKAHPSDYFTVRVMRAYKAEAVRMRFGAENLRADDVEKDMAEANAKDDWSRGHSFFHRSMFDSPYDGLAPLPPLPYLP